ncbi:hypothetical protein FD754_001641, partial [Muntiacus muntjak]
AGGSEARGLWPFTSAAGGGGPEAVVAEQALVRPRPSCAPTSLGRLLCYLFNKIICRP